MTEGPDVRTTADVDVEHEISADPAAVRALLTEPKDLRRCIPGLVIDDGAVSLVLSDVTGAVRWSGNATSREIGSGRWEIRLTGDGGDVPDITGSVAALAAGDGTRLRVTLDIGPGPAGDRWLRFAFRVTRQYLLNIEAMATDPTGSRSLRTSSSSGVASEVASTLGRLIGRLGRRSPS